MAQLKLQAYCKTSCQNKTKQNKKFQTPSKYGKMGACHYYFHFGKRKTS